MPQGNDPVADALASAKDFLANSKFKSATPAPPPKSVTDALKSRPLEGPVKPKAVEAPDTTGSELAEKKNMIEKAKKAAGDTTGMPKMHKGGVVKEDGPHDLEKGEIVIPKDKAMKKSAGLMDGFKEDADEKAESKDKKKEKGGKHEKPEAGRHKHHVKSIHVRRAEGGFIAKNEHEPNEDGSVDEATEHVLPDMDAMHGHMEEHMGEPNQGEAEADAGQSGIEGEQAPPQGA